jgi:hypothetical protein
MGNRLCLLLKPIILVLTLIGCTQADIQVTPTPMTTAPGRQPERADVPAEGNPSRENGKPESSEMTSTRFREYLEFTEAGWHFRLREETYLESNRSSSLLTTSTARGLGWSPQRKLVKDSSGNLYLTITDKSNCSGDYKNETFVFKSTDGGASWFEAPAGGGPIACLRGHHQRVGSIAIDSQDFLHVVWYGSENPESEPNERQVLYAKSTDGGSTWTPYQNISRTDTDTNEHPMISVGPNDELYVTWDGPRFTRSLDHGESWEEWSYFASSGGSSRTGSVVLSNGDIWAARSGIDMARSTDGGRTWTDQGRISHSDHDSRHASIIRDTKDNIHVVWRSSPEGELPQIRYAMYDGSSWSSPVAVSPNANAYQFYPSITKDALDNLYVAFIETNDYPYDYPDDSDDPQTGRIYVVANTGDGWGERLRVGNSDTDLYPNWSYDDNISLEDNLYLTYVTGSSDSYEIKFIPVVPLAASNAAPPDIPVLPAVNALVGHWRFEEGDGIVAVGSSDYSNDGKLVNGPTWVSGVAGQALSFDGQDDLVEVSTNQWKAGQGTVALWGKARGFSEIEGKANYLFGHTSQPPYADRIQLYIGDPEGHLNLGLGGSHTTQTNIMAFDTNKWYHIALTWDGTNYKVYVDGDQKASGTYTGLATLSTIANIGNNGGEGGEAFDGIIDDVRVYSYPLNPEEVKKLSDPATNN